MALGVSKSSARVVITVDLVSASLKKYKKHRKFIDGAETQASAECSGQTSQNA